ncbi:carbohydrate ABC transporter permease [candidate division KSB1 bacterium]|nr:carbohydrate ABC transporter permease [candidate division KSB1 bacterium]
MPIQSQKIARRIYRLFIYSVILLTSIILLIPFIWMLTSSLKNELEIFMYPPQWIPRPPRWDNYVNAWRALPFAHFFMNTVFVTGGRLIGELFACSLVAFGFSRLNARGREVLFGLLLATMMLPGQVTMIPIYILFSKIGWVNTFKPMIIPAFFGAPFYIFMLRQFFMTIPLALDEAARIDGAGSFTIYHTIFLPLARAPLLAMSIFIFMGSWNDFLGPLIYLHEMENYTLALGLQLFQSYGEYATRWDLIMAASTVLALPPLLIFFFTQRYFIRGIALTGIKI